jgi:hypothetical protein
MYIFRNIIIIAISVFFLIACHSKTDKQSDNTADTVVKNTDPSYLFDGVSLEGWEITNFLLQGAVYVKEGEIILEIGDGCTGITWKGAHPVMDYRLSLDAKRVAGFDFFCGLTFPVEDEFCSLIVGGWAGSVIGISCIDGVDASDNETTKQMYFEDNRWYHITVEVSGGKIKAMVDDQVVVDFTKGNHWLSVRPEVQQNIPIGIASWHTAAALKNIRLENISL